jgi:hypothetical protein
LNKNSQASATVLFVLGIIGMAIFGSGLITFLVLSLVFVAHAFSSVFMTLLIFFALCTAAMALMFAKGLNKRRLIARMGEYSAMFGPKTVIRIDDLAAETGISPRRIKQDMRKAQKSLHFDLYMDNAETTLIKGSATYAEYLESERLRKQHEQEEEDRKKKLEDPNTTPLDAFKMEGYAILNKIRATNAALPEEIITLKLSALETTTRRIFEYVEKYPAKLPETRKLMNYHLPITLKLVEKYREYEMMEFKPQNVVDAKENIAKTLDTVNDAFTNFLESLSHHDTLDVATDIDVLKRMLEQEGLIGKNFQSDAEKPQ